MGCKRETLGNGYAVNREGVPMNGFRFRRPSAALVVASAALFVALGGPGWAADAVPLAKRALSADKAKVADRAKTADKAKAADTAKVADRAKVAASSQTAANATLLAGKTPEQIVASVQIPPAASIAHLITVRPTHWSIPPRAGEVYITAPCAAGEKAIGGGWENPNGPAAAFDTKPSADDTAWIVDVANFANVGAEGNVFAVCAK